MKASKEISAGVHAKVCCIQNRDCLFLLMGECKTTMRFAQPGLSVADLHAHFEYICARGCAQRLA